MATIVTPAPLRARPASKVSRALRDAPIVVPKIPFPEPVITVAIDGVMVNGSARLVGWFAGVLRLVQSGLIYWYAFMMIFGLCAIYVLIKYRVFTG